MRTVFDAERITCSATAAATMLGNVLVVGTTAGTTQILDTEHLSLVKTIATAAQAAGAGATPGTAPASASVGGGTGIVTSVGVWGHDHFLVGHADGTAALYTLMGRERPVTAYAPPASAALSADADARVVSLATFGSAAKPVLAVGHACGAVHLYALKDGTWLGAKGLSASLVQAGATGLASLAPLDGFKALLGVATGGQALQVWDIASGKTQVLDLAEELAGQGRSSARITACTLAAAHGILMTGWTDGAVALRSVSRDDAGALCLPLLRVAAPTAGAGATPSVSCLSYDTRGDVAVVGDAGGWARLLPRATGLAGALADPTSAADVAAAAAAAGAASPDQEPLLGAVSDAALEGDVWTLPCSGGHVTVHAVGGVVVPHFTGHGTPLDLVHGAGAAVPLGGTRTLTKVSGEWGAAAAASTPAPAEGAHGAAVRAAAVTDLGAVMDGAAAHLAWAVEEAGSEVQSGSLASVPDLVDAANARLVLSCSLPAGHPLASLRRVIAARSGGSGVTITTTVTPREDVRLPVGLPVALRLPQGDADAAHLSIGAFEYGTTAPYAAVADGQATTALAPAQNFTSLASVPVAVAGAGAGRGAGRAPLDLTSLPALPQGSAKPLAGTVQVCGVEEGAFTLTSALHGGAGVAVTWDAGALPHLLLQFTAGRLVATPCVAALDLGVPASAGPNPLAARHMATAVDLAAGEAQSFDLTLAPSSE